MKYNNYNNPQKYHNFWGKNCCGTCKCGNCPHYVCAFALNSTEQFCTHRTWKSNNVLKRNNAHYITTANKPRIESILCGKFLKCLISVTVYNSSKRCVIFICISFFACSFDNKHSRFVFWVYGILINGSWLGMCRMEHLEAVEYSGIYISNNLFGAKWADRAEI